jgi:hypothetical protein
MPAGASVASDETSDKSVVGKDAQVLAKSLEMMKIFDDLQGLGLFDDYKGTSDIENSIHAYEHTIPQDICTVPSCGEYNHHLSRLCEKHMTQFITLETKPEEITVLQAAFAEPSKTKFTWRGPLVMVVMMMIKTISLLICLLLV